MMKVTRVCSIALLTIAAVVGVVGQRFAVLAVDNETFEVSGIKAVRPHLVNTIAALNKDDFAGAKEAFEAYDSAWNGIEVYINTRDKSMYNELELNYQAKITKGLDSPTPDKAALLADAQAMLAKYDEAISTIEKAPPLNPLFDDVARLRIVRANLREVTPALKAGNFAKARKSYEAFDDKWDSIEDLIKARSADSYTEIEKAMIQIESALKPEKPDVDQVTALVKGIMDKYNAAVGDITKDARAHQ
jgi:tetratricopeptide (TPR) repeat protein